MGKKKDKALPHYRKLLKAKAAGGAAATRGRARTFADKKDILAANTGDSEIDEGLVEYNAKRAPSVIIVDVDLRCQIGLSFPAGETPTGDALKAAIEKTTTEYLKESMTDGVKGVACLITQFKVRKDA